MNQNDSSTGQGRSSQPKFNFPKSQIDQATREMGGDFVLIDAQTGRVWSSLSDHKYVDRALRQATEQLQPEGVSG